jgi:hypothetical protein
MVLLLFVGCFERSAQRLDATVNLGAGTAEVSAAWEDVQLGDEVTTVEGALHELRKELEAAREYAEGATAASVHFAYEAGRLDLVAHYVAPLDWFESQRNLPLRVGWSATGTEWARGDKGRHALFLWAEKSAEASLILTTTGPWRVARLADDDPDTWVVVAAIDHGKGTVHLESHNLGEDGKPTPPSGWVASVAGLAEALPTSGLLTDAPLPALPAPPPSEPAPPAEAAPPAAPTPQPAP